MPPILIAAIAAAVLIVLFTIAAWIASGWMLSRRDPDPARTPAELGLPFEKVIFQARDGVRLAGRLTRTAADEPAERRAVIIFCAGMFGSMDGDTDMIPIFTDAGYDVLQFDWRAHGLSEGKQGSLGLREPLDVLGAMDFLELRGIKKMGLMGFSFGGAVVLHAAALDHRALAIACDSPFVQLGHAIEGVIAEQYSGPRAALLRLLTGPALALAGMRLRDNLRRAEPAHTAQLIAPCPVLMIHGHDDPIVPVDDQDDLFTACSDPKALWRVEGAGHREVYQREPEEYRKHVLEFFDRHLV